MEKQKKHPLNALGVTKESEIVLLNPEKYIDCRSPLTDYSALQDGQSVVLRGEITRPPAKRWPRNSRIKTPLFVFQMSGTVGQAEFVLFGDCEKFQEAVVGTGPVHIHGIVSFYGSTLQLKDTCLIDTANVGRVLPFYPGTRGKMKAERVTNYMHSRYPKARTEAIQMLRDRLAIHDENDKSVLQYADTAINSLSALLDATHAPSSPESAIHALSVWETVSAFYMAKALDKTRGVQTGAQFAMGVGSTHLEDALKVVPFVLADDQRQAVDDIAASLNAPRKTHHLVNGDVGSGKTIVFLAVAAACARSGKRVAIMAPNGPLAKQIYSELATLWPDLSKQFVNGETPAQTPIDQQVVVGTQALFHRLGPDDGIDLVVVDEQQRYSVDQRESFLSSSGNLIEATATCIPRTMALLQFGNIGISRIRQQHAQKTINTRLMGPADSRAVFGMVKAFVDRGDRVLVVYPLKEGRDSEEDDFDRASIIESYEVWERCFPGQTSMLHGSMKEAEKNEALHAIQSKEKPLLIATTVVEVGINIPDLMYCVVVDPERAGLVSLHQIRGRLVRHGGHGMFDLFNMNEISKKTQKRLDVLVNHNDGFAIAEEDLKLRGAGDLTKSSRSQSGKANGLLLNQPINTEYVKFFLDLFDQRDLAA